eukprot:SAG31_NODE_35121_length_326_cov_0.682819_1_plen_82_part_10
MIQARRELGRERCKLQRRSLNPKTLLQLTISATANIQRISELLSKARGAMIVLEWASMSAESTIALLTKHRCRHGHNKALAR